MRKLASPTVAVFALAVLVSPAAGFAQATPRNEARAAETVLPGTFLLQSVQTSKSLRRTSRFLDVSKLQGGLQLAFVIDGTESMDASLQDVGSQLNKFMQAMRQLVREQNISVSVAVVIYRDDKAESGPVTPVFDSFQIDLDLVSQKLTEIRTETGRPYFRERVDEGIAHALENLNWVPADEVDTARWLIVIGDAPPYPVGVSNQFARERKFSNEQLLEMAKAKGVSIYGMVTQSGFLKPGLDDAGLLKTMEIEKPEFNDFLATLSQSTDGRSINLDDPSQVQFWLTGKQQMEPIRPEEVQAYLNESTASNQSSVRMAVLPFLPLPSMNFDAEPDSREIAVSTQIRERLSRVPNVTLASLAETRDAFEKLKSKPDADAAASDTFLAEFAKELNVDYVVRGEFQPVRDTFELNLSLVGQDGKELVAEQAELRANDEQQSAATLNEMFDRVFREAVSVSRRERSNESLVSVFSQLNDVDNPLADEILAPLTADNRAQREILAALTLLEDSLVFPKDPERVNLDEEQQAQRTLLAAQRHLDRACEFEKGSPFANYLMAICYYNLSQHEAATDELTKCYERLRVAYDNLERIPNKKDPIRTEIEATYKLLISKDVGAAVEKYEQLLSHRADNRGRFALRAHWMLVGIHLGEWGAISHARKLVDVKAARPHILALLAYWPESPEAKFYQQCIKMKNGGYEMDVPVGSEQFAKF